LDYKNLIVTRKEEDIMTLYDFILENLGELRDYQKEYIKQAVDNMEEDKKEKEPQVMESYGEGLRSSAVMDLYGDFWQRETDLVHSNMSNILYDIDDATINGSIEEKIYAGILYQIYQIYYIDHECKGKKMFLLPFPERNTSKFLRDYGKWKPCRDCSWTKMMGMIFC
jgi:hypothetical protein